MKNAWNPGGDAAYLFHQGTNYRSYEFLGCHTNEDGRTLFRVWAPSAREVSIIGDWNNWIIGTQPMSKISEQGIWEIITSDAKIGQHYKFAILTDDGRILKKADPFEFYGETDG